MRKLFLSLILVLFLFTNVWGADIVFTVSKTGADEPSCVTDPPTTDCLTIQYVYDLYNMGSSDIIDVREGVYNEQVTLGLNDAYSILQGHEGETVIIDGEGVRDYGIDTNAMSYIQIKNLTVRNAVIANIRTNAVNASDSINLVLEDIVTYGVSAGSNHHNVALKGSDVTLTRVTSYNSDQDCFHSNGSNYLYDECVAYNCDLQNLSGDVLYHISGSLTVQNSILTKETNNKTVIRHSLTTELVTITGNTLTSTGTAGVLTISGGATGNIVSRNTFINGAYGIYFDVNADTNGTIHNNLFYGQTISGIYFINGAASTWKIYNNTVYSPLPLRVGDATTVDTQNNIFYNTTPSGYLAFIHTTGNYTGDTNIFYPESPNFMAYKGTVVDTLVEWVSTSGSDTISLNSDPLFKHANGTNFYLHDNSPAIGAAADLGPPYNIDRDGKDQDDNLPWDMGAFMYIAPPECEKMGYQSLCN